MNLSDNISSPAVRRPNTILGIGLMLGRAAVERCGGRLELRNHPQGGALAQMHLPRAPDTPREAAP